MADSVRIYIVDTGIRSQHSELKGPDLRSRVQPGVNITKKPLEPGRYDTEDCFINSHGTHVSAIAAGNTYGVAKRALLVPVRLTSSCHSSNQGGEVSLEDFVHAIDWIIANHPTGTPGIVSYSTNPNLDPDANPKYVEAVRRLAQKGLLLVESAGNDENDAGPNSFSGPGHPREGVIIVGGLDPNNRRWRRLGANDDDRLCGLVGDCGSNFGPAVDLWAPAQYIVSASNRASDSGSFQGICRLSGTSMAAPHVSGLAARLWARYPTLRPQPSRLRSSPSRSPASTRAAASCLRRSRVPAWPPRTGGPTASSRPRVRQWRETTASTLSPYRRSRSSKSAQGRRFRLGQPDSAAHRGRYPSERDPGGHGPFTQVHAAPWLHRYGSFTYTIQDGSGNSATANVWIVVENLDEPPVAWTDCFEVAANGSVVISQADLLSNDWDSEGGSLESPELLVDVDPQQGRLAELAEQ